jgi:hypothetical protein
MARLEDLINDIADPSLRNQIAGEVGKLKARKKFGLVFEEHLPEVVQLPGLAVKPGARVAKRNDKVAGFFLVRSVVNGKKVEGAEDEDDEEMAEAEDDTDVAEVADEKLPFPPEEIDEWELRHARRRGSESSYRHQRMNQFYPIYINPKDRLIVRAGPALLPLDKKPSFAKVDGLLAIWPIDKDGNERCWRFISPKMQELIDAGRIRLGKYNAASDRIEARGSKGEFRAAHISRPVQATRGRPLQMPCL